MLRSQISAADIDRLVLTKRYELLLSMVARVSPDINEKLAFASADPKALAYTFKMDDDITQHPVVNDLLITEIQERTAAFDEARNALRRQIERWSRPGVFIGLDTSVYITHPQKLEDIDMTSLVNVQNNDIHILVPMVVVEELDGLKQRGDNHARWRAAHSLAVFDRVLPDPATPARFRIIAISRSGSNDIRRGEVSVELLFDTPGHTRLPVNDDEIIDRLLTTQSLADRPVTLVTYDTNQAFKARAAGLRVNRLKMQIECEPEPAPRNNAQRKRRDNAPKKTDSNNSRAEHDATPKPVQSAQTGQNPVSSVIRRGDARRSGIRRSQTTQQ